MGSHIFGALVERPFVCIFLPENEQDLKGENKRMNTLQLEKINTRKGSNRWHKTKNPIIVYSGISLKNTKLGSIIYTLRA